MKKWMLMCAAVTVAGTCAEPMSAQEAIQAPTQMVTPTTTVTTAPRMGLFGRLRARRQGTVVSEPMVAPTVTPAPTMTPMVAKPMPMVQTTEATSKAPSTVQESQYPPIQSGVKQTPATMPAATTPMPAPVTTMDYVAPRQGLFSRLRARRGM